MLVYDKVPGYSFESKNFQIINVPMSTSQFFKQYIIGQSYEIRFVGIYKQIFTNNEVIIGDKSIGILDWLNQQKYSFGIANLFAMTGSFAVFEALGIENTFDVSSTVFYPQYLQFLDDNDGKSIDVTQYQVPEFSTAEPGDWKKEAEIWKKNSDRYNLNIKNHKISNYDRKILLNDLSIEFYNILFHKTKLHAKKPPSNMEVLLKKSKIHFVNQHPFEIFKTFPKHEKIVYIGGIHVEDKNILTKRVKKENNKKPQCVVLVSFGTVKLSGEFNAENIEIMFKRFEKHESCKFLVRIGIELLPESFNKKKIEVTNGNIEQQKILSEKNTKLFISHCGQHSLIEAFYAGVPLICIPNSADQFYNSSIVEYLGIGIYVKMLDIKEGKDIQDRNNKFEYDFIRAFNDIISHE
uniref:glucuronosyltransferase n=1 Tax=Meloidogyne hapla TaxID=6305 RepID=A0A1I8B692_MELHA